MADLIGCRRTGCNSFTASTGWIVAARVGSTALASPSSFGALSALSTPAYAANSLILPIILVEILSLTFDSILLLTIPLSELRLVGGTRAFPKTRARRKGRTRSRAVIVITKTWKVGDLKDSKLESNVLNLIQS